MHHDLQLKISVKPSQSPSPKFRGRQLHGWFLLHLPGGFVDQRFGHRFGYQGTAPWIPTIGMLLEFETLSDHVFLFQTLAKSSICLFTFDFRFPMYLACLYHAFTITWHKWHIVTPKVPGDFYFGQPWRLSRACPAPASAIGTNGRGTAVSRGHRSALVQIGQGEKVWKVV